MRVLGGQRLGERVGSACQCIHTMSDCETNARFGITRVILTIMGSAAEGRVVLSERCSGRVYHPPGRVEICEHPAQANLVMHNKILRESTSSHPSQEPTFAPLYQRIGRITGHPFPELHTFLTDCHRSWAL